MRSTPEAASRSRRKGTDCACIDIEGGSTRGSYGQGGGKWFRVAAATVAGVTAKNEHTNNAAYITT